MSLEKLMQALDDADIKVCPICGIPYSPYHSRQKTCGEDYCKRKYKNEYLKERRKRLLEEDPVVFRKYRAESMRKYRAKKKYVEERDRQLAGLKASWEEMDANVTGFDYGKRQAEKTLQSVEKINVELGGNNDDIHTGHDTTGS